MKKKILAGILAGVLSLGLIGCGSNGATSNEGSNSSDDKIIKIGVSPEPHASIVEVAKPLLEEKGYTVEIVEFNDYVLPNTAVEEGELDANYFQTIAYLESFNDEKDTHLTYTAEIHLEPMGAFSNKYKSLDEVVSIAKNVIENSKFIFVPDTLEYLKKGGRIGGAAALFESLLQIRPILTVEDGKTTVFTKVRTKKKAIDKIVNTILEQNSKSPIKGLIVHHINCESEGQELANRLKSSLGLDNVKIQSIGPIIGLHVGPGSIGVAYHY